MRADSWAFQSDNNASRAMERTGGRLACSTVGLWLGLLLLCSWGFPGSAEPRAPPENIAIIGAGIGGTSAAYYLRQKFGNDVKIDVFEKGEVGGRLATVTMQGQEYESGGSVIHPLNLHMKRFVKDLGLSAVQSPSGLVGVYNGETLVYEESSWFIINMIKLIWHYGFQSLRMHMWVEDILDKFMRIYRYQSHDYAFSSVEKLLHSLGGDDYLGLFNRSLLETLQKAGFSEKFLDEIITPVMRVNYGQTMNINGFVGAVSMSCTDPGLWAVKGGNKLVCSRLLQASKSNLISGSVMSIEEKTRTKQTGNPTKVYEAVYQTGSETHSAFYDIVLVATPLNRKMSNITFLNFDPPIEEFHQYYEPLVTTLIKGQLNSTVFTSRALDEFDLGTVLTTDNPDLFINSIGFVSSVEESNNPQPKADRSHVWKIFSAGPLTKEQILKLFVSYDYAVKRSWLAYPHYTPPEKCPSIILHDRLYYLNGMEVAASAMEVSAVAGYNAALLAYHRWNGHTHMIDQEDLYEKLKTEL
ncbi:prenylcysteine oxidase 1 [Orcinus orca]|uniref:prenylcysteine oxidase 1 n=1 Tax=Orcinus orca TaxID=9733 RepID=UPI000F44133D|nr:prenylcysteine oxidase 1 [Orcinus orca]XP_026987741.1 prenylcysteine oxidase 1 [Lagenorhynchus obliquidens]